MSETIAGTSADWTGKTYTPDSFPADIDYELRVAAANHMNNLRVYDTPGGGGQAAAATFANWRRHLVSTSRLLSRLSSQYGFSYSSWYNLQNKTNINLRRSYYSTSPHPGLSYNTPLISLTILTTDLTGGASYHGPLVFNSLLDLAARKTMFQYRRDEYARQMARWREDYNRLTPQRKREWGIDSWDSFLRVRENLPYNPARVTADDADHIHNGDIFVITKGLPEGEIAVFFPYTALGATDFGSFLRSLMRLTDRDDVLFIGVDATPSSSTQPYSPYGIRIAGSDVPRYLNEGITPDMVAKYSEGWLAALADYQDILTYAFHRRGVHVRVENLTAAQRAPYDGQMGVLSYVRGVVMQMAERMVVRGSPDSTTAAGPYGPPVLGIHAYNEQTGSPPAGDPLAGDPHAPALPLPGDPTLPPLAGVPQAGLPVGGEAPAGIPMAALAVLGLAAIALIMSQRRKS